MKSWEPHFEQNNFSRFADDLYDERLSAPTMDKAAVGTKAFVEKAAPWALRHIEQWQFSAWVISVEIEYLTEPQRQLPVSMRRCVLCGLTFELSRERRQAA